ncbi:MAG TPA: PAS domain S-box protein [Salinivirgaceae bacterium]|nr:PAS domain S-box protein [Salinivirgaceae bacterium]
MKISNIYLKATSSFRVKLLLFVSTLTAFILIVTIGYMSIKTSRISQEDAEMYLNQTTTSLAQKITTELNTDFNLVQNLSMAFNQMPNYEQSIRDSITKEMLKNAINDNNHIQSIWLQWELNKISANFQYGSVKNSFYRQNNAINFKIDTLEHTGYGTKGLYYQIKAALKNLITEPYISYVGEQQNKVISVCSPIIYKGQFAGAVGMDLPLNYFDNLIQKIELSDSSYLFFLSNQGTIISHKDQKTIGKNITEILENRDININTLVDVGKQFSFYHKNSRKTNYYICFSPVYIGNTDMPWSLGLVFPQKAILSKSNEILFNTIIICLIGLTLVLLFVYLFAIRFSKPLNNVSKVINKLALGEIESVNRLTNYSNDEIGQISNSLNLLIDRMFEMSEFTKEIGKGRLDAEYKAHSEEDVIGLSLIEMQNNLKGTRSQELQRRKNEDLQTWINSGVAQMNELLRQQDLDFQQHTYSALKFIVDYIKANQGVLFIAQEIENPENEEENVEFVAFAALAWGRKRSITKAYKIGESLVGRCAFERESIYLTQVPQNYVNITSGLGKANPNYIILIPLEMNDDILGVVEIASFNPIVEHEIEFIEKACYGLASTIAARQVSERTNRLLEQTKIQTEELTQKEEEMRQNMEELIATQEEFAKRDAEIESLKDAVNVLTYIFHLDLSGEIVYANNNFCNFMGISKEQLVGKSFNFMTGFEISEPDEMSNSHLWELLSNGEVVKTSRTYTFAGNIRKLSEVYSPVNDTVGNLVKVICVATEFIL